MTSPTAFDDYTRAVNVVGLEAGRRQRLLDHLLRTSMSDLPPVSASTARCAATLLAADTEQRLSAPTALAQAEILATVPEAGAALMQAFDSLMTLAGLAQRGWGGLGLHRAPLKYTLSFLARELQRLVAQLETSR